MSVKISFIIPMYHVANHLAQCLDSILTQTVSKEIILINDGSTDDTLNIALNYQKQHSEILVLTQSNHGQAHARNQGLHLARGEYVCFVDADDFLIGNLMPLFCQLLDHHQHVDILRYHAVIQEKTNANFTSDTQATRFVFLNVPRVIKIRPDDSYTYTIRSGIDWTKQVIQSYAWTAWVWLYVFRRDFLIKHHIYFHENLKLEDVHFTAQLLLHTSNSHIIEIDAFPYIYRKHDDSTMGKLDNAPTVYFTQLASTLNVIIEDWVGRHDSNNTAYYLNQLLQFEIGNLVKLYHNKFTDKEKIIHQDTFNQFVRINPATGNPYAYIAKYPHVNADITHMNDLVWADDDVSC